MASTSSPPPVFPPTTEANALPQYGFGPEVTFEGLVAGNPFLFRVYTPRGHPPQYDSNEAFFVGPKYDDEFSSAAFRSSCADGPSAGSRAATTYADVAQHLDWTTRSSSPYISTSFSFAWAIWEAIRRYHTNVKHDVEIAVIDAKAVADRAITAVELLARGNQQERHKDHWRWYRFAVESQDVLVWGHIPGSAVLASVPLLQILSKLPSYFLYHDIADTKESPLFKLGWDYRRKKPSYRQFCQAMSDRFMQMSVDKRLRDTTAGSVRLALALLRPHVHKHVSDDFVAATKVVCDLAYVIAQWPGQWWAREHPEIREIVRCVVHMIGEEMREARRVQALEDANRMQDIVGGLEQLAQAYQARARPHKVLEFSPQPSPSPTLPPSPTPYQHKHLRLGSIDMIVDDMIQTEEPTTIESETEVEPLEDDTAKASLIPSIPVVASASVYEGVARTASCFLTGLLVGSFIALCVLSPDRRQLAHHLT